MSVDGSHRADGVARTLNLRRTRRTESTRESRRTNCVAVRAEASGRGAARFGVCVVPAREHLNGSGGVSGSSSSGTLRIRPVFENLSSSTPAASTSILARKRTSTKCSRCRHRLTDKSAHLVGSGPHSNYLHVFATPDCPGVSIQKPDRTSRLGVKQVTHYKRSRNSAKRPTTTGQADRPRNTIDDIAPRSPHQPSRSRRLAVDGQHLGDADACRRDRRKDRLPEEFGPAVLRSCAEDLATDLDTIRDLILRSVAGANINRL